MSGLSVDVFKSILKGEFGASEEDGVFKLGEEQRVSALLEHESGLIQVAKVRRVRFGDGFVAVYGEEDTYYVPPSALFALRGQDSDEESDKKPGFRR